MNISKTVKTYLQKQKIAHSVIEHKTVFTAYDLAQTLKQNLDQIAKVLLVNVDRKPRIVILRASDRVDPKKIKLLLQAKKVEIANERQMVKTMRVKPGALTAFGGLYRQQPIIDAALSHQKEAIFPSGSFRHSLLISLKQYLKSEQPLVDKISVPSKLKLQAKIQTKKRR